MRHHRRIIKTSHLLYVLVAGFLFNCSPKAVKKTATQDNYKEDLTSVRPPLDSVVTVATVKKVKAPYAEPENDITEGLNAIVDSLAVDNTSKKNTIYTIQVYVGNSRDEANEARTRVFKVLTDEIPKLEYSAPNYRVKVGSFKDRLAAHKTMTLLKDTFPGAILLPDKVYINDEGKN